MSWPSRSHGAGDVTEADVGQEVTVCGWVDRNRNLGGLGFMDIRDHTGLLQVWALVWGGCEDGRAVVVLGDI
jgi:aspartyl-tRNA synthetase